MEGDCVSMSVCVCLLEPGLGERNIKINCALEPADDWLWLWNTPQSRRSWMAPPICMLKYQYLLRLVSALRSEKFFIPEWHFSLTFCSKKYIFSFAHENDFKRNSGGKCLSLALSIAWRILKTSELIRYSFLLTPELLSSFLGQRSWPSRMNVLVPECLQFYHMFH